MSKPTCGVCGNVMTPENSKMSPELFLCDDCALTLQMKAGVARENELAWREQIESLNAQNAAMREALEDCERWIRFTPPPGFVHRAEEQERCIAKSLKALSATPPTNYVSKEAVRPLVEALQKAQDLIYNGYAPVGTIKEALTTSRQLGLLE